MPHILLQTLLIQLLSGCHPLAVIQPQPDDTEQPSDTAGGDDTSHSHDSAEILPGIGVPEFSVQRGFFTDPFDLVISSSVAGAKVATTLDGSDPCAEAVRWSPTPLTLNIDPDDETGRFTAPAVVVRACLSLDGWVSDSVTHSYIFLDRMADLSPDNRPPGAGWPAIHEAWSDDEWNEMDYGIDQRVCDAPAYAAIFQDAFLAIPTFSIVTDLANLFDPQTGIYENAMEHGSDWERPASLELMDPQGEGFQINMGLRIRGGWSRHSDDPKHAFRFHFRSEYGPSTLEYPLFGDEGVAEFDTIDLRTSQNYSWSYKSDTAEENTMNRDVFSRDTQRDMGRPYTRSRYYHLYLDGVYWGLYQTQERSEASFAVSYFGGEKDDWDVVKVDGDDPSARIIEATDGNTDSWRQVWEMCQAGFGSDETYWALQGRNPDGSRDPAMPVLVDVDNLIDYMLVIFWTANFDAPTGAFTGNDEPNNFFLIDNRADPDDGFRFFAHDSEHTLLAQAWSPGIGLYEDRVNLGTRSDDYRMQVASFIYFHPQWLHYKLTAHADYRQRFNARVHEEFFDDGVFTPAACAARFQTRADELELAIVAESARWGDAQSFNEGGRTWRTRDDDWVPAVARVMDDFTLGTGGQPTRTDIVLGQLEAAGLYTP